MAKIAESSDQAIHETLSDLLDSGDEVTAGKSLSTGAELTTKEFLSYQFSISNPTARLTYNPKLKLRLPLAVARFTWLVAGNDRLHDIAFYSKGVNRFSDDNVIVPGSSYGRRIRYARPGLDQLVSCIARLREDQASRRAALTIYFPEDAERESADIPCAFGIFFHVREGSLKATVLMRSNNAFMLMPYNIFEFSLISEIVASALEIEFDSLSYFAGSMHLYERDFEEAHKALSDENSYLVNTGLQMPKMPRNKDILTEVNSFVILEAELRHSSGSLGEKNIQDWIARAQEKLSPYWCQLFYILMIHVLRENESYAGLEIVINHLEPVYKDYLGNITEGVSGKETGSELILLDLLPPADELDLIGGDEAEIIAGHVRKYEEVPGNVVPWEVYKKLLQASQKVAAREGVASSLKYEMVEKFINEALEE